MSQQPGFSNYGEQPPAGSTPPPPPPFPQQSAEVSADQNAEGVSYNSQYVQRPQASTAPSPSPYGQSATSSLTTQEKNWMGIVSLIGAFVFPLMGVIFGHMALSAAKKNEADNRGMALAGLIISYAYFALLFFAVIIFFALGFSASTTGTTY